MEVIAVLLIFAAIYWYTHTTSFLVQRFWYCFQQVGRATDDHKRSGAQKAALSLYHKLRGRGLTGEQIYDLLLRGLGPGEEKYFSGLHAWCEGISIEGDSISERSEFKHYVEFWETEINAVKTTSSKRTKKKRNRLQPSALVQEIDYTQESCTLHTRPRTTTSKLSEPPDDK